MRTLGIDPSKNGTGLCLLDDESVSSEPVLLEYVAVGERFGIARSATIADRVAEIIDTHQPHLIAMEGYAFGAPSSTIAQLCEIGGMIKLIAHRAGYDFGYGTGQNRREREAAREATLTSRQLFVTQTVTQMKKFCLGAGNVSKDPRYLLTVFKAMGREFESDDFADAYMHAWMAQIVLEVLRGNIEISHLYRYQQEALISAGVKQRSGLSLAKAMKLPDEQKRELVGF